MSNYGPWSVKGSDERAREAAREAAREEGLTIGEYINRMLKMETGSAGGPVGEVPASARDEDSPRYARSGGGDGGDGEYPGSTAAIHDLLRRLEAMEARSAVALSGIDRSIHDLTSRLDDAHRKTDGLSSSYDGVIDDIRTTHDALKSKVDALEGNSGRKGDVRALKSLEQALGKLASHVYDETSRQKDGTAAVRKRVETGLEDLGSRLTGVEGRIDKTLDEAADRLARKVEQAELRTEGATKHLSGRFSELETRVAERLARAEDVAKRVEAVETSTTGTIGSMEQMIEALQARLERAETATNDALDNVDQTFTALSTRVSELADKALPDTANTLREQFESRFRGLSAELRSSIETTRKELAEEIEQAAGKAARHEQVDAVRNSVRDLADALERRDSNTQASIGTLRQDMDSSGKSSRVAMEELSRRVDTNWTASQAALDTLRQRFDSKDSVSAKTLDEMRQRLDARQDKAETELSSLRDRVETVASQAVSPATMEAIQKAVGAIRTRLAANEKTSADTLQKVSERITRVSDFLDGRVKQIESRDYAQQVEAVRADMQALSHDLTRRMESAGGQNDEMIEQISAEMKRLAEHFETRVDESEKRSAQAIEQVGEQVSSVAQRLQARQDRSFRELEETLESERNSQQKRLSDALNGVSDRIEAMQERSTTSISPVQKAIASLASRLEALESDDEPAASVSQPGPAKSSRNESAYDDFLSEEAPAPKRKQEKARKPDGFEAGLPFLDELDEASPVDAGGAYEYETELPAEDEADPFADFSDFDERPASRHDEYLETARPPADDSWGFSDEEPAATTGRVSRQRSGSDDYLSRARKAALDASEATPAKAPKKTKGKRAKTTPEPKKSSKVPLLAAVSVIAVATAAAGAVVVLRGLQDDGPRQSVQTRDTLSLAAADTAVPAAAGDPDAETASEEAGPPPVDEARAETVNSVQAPGEDADLEQELFAEDEAAAQDEEGEISLAGVSDPTATPPSEADTVEAAPEPSPRATLASLSPIPEAPTLETAAVSGDPVAQYLVGQERLDAGDYTSGPSMIRRAAEQGQPAAQYRLAKLHESGLGVPRDLEMARQWTERAATGGNVKAMHDLAVYYAEGEGGPQTYAGAAEWFRKAADYGLTDSQYNLAVLYEAGLGISEDASQALYWYAVAAQQGDSGAPAKVEELSGIVGPQEAAEVRARAEGWSASRPDRAANGVFPQQSAQGEASVEQIAGVQRTLAALGHEPGPADGLMGAGTLAAIRNYQRENGFDETGEVSPELIDSLNARIRAAQS